MDRERKAVHQLDDTVYEIVVQCFGAVQISDNYSSRRCNRAFYALFRAVAETIEPKMNNQTNKNARNQLFTHVQYSIECDAIQKFRM